ncbi:MAG TPA: hypothetical protein VHA33_06085 [Candidatus Angelobacter sp.]|jgi:hypothetical protein|nr:hypothetical protein [Candidatus Angelobacter sp.]
MHYLVILGAVVNLYGIAHYIRGIFHGKIKPNLVSWVLWTIAPLVASAAALSTGARWAALPTFMVGFCPLLVVVSISIKKHSIWRPTKFSYLCGALSLIALLLWAITKNPEIAIIFAILSDGLAAVPTLKKAWQYPDTELGVAYTATLFNILTSFSATHLYTFSEIGFPIYNALLHVALSFAVYKRSFLVRANTPSIDS